MLGYLYNETNHTYTANGAVTNASTGSCCLDLFFQAGALRNRNEEYIEKLVLSAFAEDPVKTLKIIFYARDVRGGLGERRFFRIAVRALAKVCPEAVERNLKYIPEYGRYDDICALVGTPCESRAAAAIAEQLKADKKAYESGQPVSLLAKWLPSVNASSKETRRLGSRMASLLKMSEPEYRRTLSTLRKYIDILEDRLRRNDYSFGYDAQPSCAMMKYRQAFLRNDHDRYVQYIQDVKSGKKTVNASVLYPYEIVRRAVGNLTEEDRMSLDVMWNALPSYGESSGNAIAVVDCSGSMTCGGTGNVRPIDAAVSLGIYFAEHNTGAFADHFITFSERPALIKLKDGDIAAKVKHCMRYNDPCNTNLEAVFRLILNAAVKNNVPQEELPERLYIISDMEFDSCVENGNSDTMFRTMQRMYAKKGYKLPQVLFWNVNSWGNKNLPLTRSETGAALVSGFSPSLFDMVIAGDVSPERLMDDVLNRERYAPIE